ncbi:uracil-DNA glycosylase [Acholeplasma granularum]|uniref:uracil-DNA glycosylase n=1 Tax=Acholeplasma granularum TaxID=264635 RepID=UPI00046FC94A|nr:uracil-DNA glycosylase [Acholeplasma granularum]
MWTTWISKESKKPYFKNLMDTLENEIQTKTIYPKKDNWFFAFEVFTTNELKVVILGQDPYHSPNQAHGLSFSTLNEKLPPSLKNIFKELYNDLNISNSNQGDLTSWAKQGVLLLNTILTVEQGKPLSHKNLGWEIFTLEIIKQINLLNQPIVFILWGNQARSYKKYLNNPKHLYIESAHPSPLSAYNGFFGSKPFSKTNDFLKNQGVKPIDWKL